MRCRVLLAFAIACLMSTSANAGFLTGQDLQRGLRLAKSPDRASLATADLFAALSAVGYVNGAYDAYEHMAFTGPPNLQAGTVHAVVLKWLDDHPSTWMHPASPLIMVALVDAWGTPEEKARISEFRAMLGIE